MSVYIVTKYITCDKNYAIKIDAKLNRTSCTSSKLSTSTQAPDLSNILCFLQEQQVAYTVQETQQLKKNKKKFTA